jgi:signal transduction histidine kinase/DNA-binding response OmpR family regulator
MRSNLQTGTRNHRYALSLVAPATLLFVAAICFATWLLFAAADRLNKVSFEGERHIATSLMKANFDRLAKVVADYSFWDDMFDQFSGTYDKQWAADNLDQYSIDAFGIDAVLVADGTGEVHYAYTADGDHKFKPTTSDKADLARAVSTVLKRSVPGKPLALVGVVTIGDVPHLASIGAITPNTEARLKSVGPPTKALVQLVELEPFIRSLAQGFGFRNLELVEAGSGYLAVQDDFRDRPAFALRWLPKKIGTDFLSDTLPLSAAAFVLCLGVFVSATVGWLLLARRLSRALAAAESANQAKTEFLALMSHEIRTPMNGVLGMTNALFERADNEEMRAGLSTLRDSGESLLRIINDVLDFSKLEANRLDIENALFDLPQLLRHSVEICTPSAEAKGISLRIELGENIPTHVRGDAGRLRQVLLNIVNNATKFTQNGEVRVSANLVAGQNASRLRVEVQDTGIGIDPAILPSLFQRFTQADASISRKFGGTGLGLAICKKLIERMKGRIGADSVLGNGSTFWFEVPLELATSTEIAAFAQTEARSGVDEALTFVRDLKRPVRLLLVEDNSTNQLVAKLALEKWGIRPDTAINGVEAVEAVRRRNYDLILMDMHMPEMDGLAATRAIRSLRGAAARTPIIALTANAFDSDVKLCLAAGMNGHISKPFSSEQLIVAIAGALKGAAFPDDSLRAEILDPAAAIDLKRLEIFRKENGEEMLRLLIDVFVQESIERLRRLETLLAEGQTGHESVRLAHTLKSSGAMAGAAAFSAAARELEQKLCTNANDAGVADVGALRNTFDEYRRALAANGMDRAA